VFECRFSIFGFPDGTRVNRESEIKGLAMAVAEKTTAETTLRSPHQQLVMGSILGALFLLLSVGLVFSGLPALWGAIGLEAVNPFLSQALLFVITLPLIVGLVLLGRHLLGPHPPAGVRAGAFFGAVGLLVVALVTLAIGNWMATTQMGTAVEAGVTLLIGAALLYGLAWLFLKPGFGRWLVAAEENGWFHATSFKGNQGVRVRRGTVIALIVLVVCGIYTLVDHGSIESGTWSVQVPFVDDAWLTLLYQTNITVPLILMLAAGWIAWRIVNWPVFADFLIATEAEMNKVSWTTRKRLYQDTIVVLVTVFLFTMFLFIVDILWIKILSNPILRVLDVDLPAERAKQNAPTQW
jgi:preprotein translocase SecE subunit